MTQRVAAEQAGMSKDQEVQAVRVANVPAEEFELAVESDDPGARARGEHGTRRAHDVRDGQGAARRDPPGRGRRETRGRNPGGVPPVSTAKKGKRGPAKKAGSKRDVAERTGTDRKTATEIERHVALAEAYPFMQRADWNRSTVLDAGGW